METDDGALATSRTRDRVITESGQPCREHEQAEERTPLGGFPREIAAWVGYVDPKHEAGKLIQRITKGTLRATEAWTDGRHAEDDKYDELGCELA